MSLDARFTQLRSSSDRSRGGPVNPRFQRTHSPRERVSSLKNRLLAMEMAERPNVMAALSRGRGRMGRGNFMGPIGGFIGGGGAGMRRARSPFPRSRSRQRNGALGRSNSVGRLTRSQSMQSLMSISSDNGFEMMGGRIGRPGRGGRGGGGFRTRVFTRGSRIGARGGIQKLNMDLVANARKRRSASLSRLGSNVGAVGFRRGGRGARGIPAGGAGVKARLGVRPGGLTRSNSLSSLVPRGGARGAVRGGSRGRGAVRGSIRQRSNSISRRGGGNLSARVGNLNGRGGTPNARGGNLNTRGGRGRSGVRGTARGNKGVRQQNGGNRGGFRGRGNRGGAAVARGRGGKRGRGVARGGRGGTKTPPPKKEDLDNELDQYMSKTKSFLDKQLDQYMAQPAATA